MPDTMVKRPTRRSRNQEEAVRLYPEPEPVPVTVPDVFVTTP